MHKHYCFKAQLTDQTLLLNVLLYGYNSMRSMIGCKAGKIFLAGPGITR